MLNRTVDPLTRNLQRVPPGRRRAALVTAPRRPFAGFLSACVLTTLLGVGHPGLSAQTITVAISPNPVKVNTGATQQFTPKVTGTSDQFVTWSLSGGGCAGNTCGSITGAGFYTAPKVAPNPPTVYVKGTSFVNSSAFGLAVVTVVPPPPITVTISPNPVTVNPNGQQQFSAVVTGSSNTAVNWTATGAGCISYNCGTISSTGLYKAPPVIPNPPTINIIAASQADPTKRAVVPVTLAVSVSVTVTPPTVQLLVGHQQQFSASVAGTSNGAVTWSVSGPGCSGASCGSVTSTGVYTAPAKQASPPTVFVTATSNSNPSKSASATVTLSTTISVKVTPSSVHVNPGLQQQFTAVVSGSTNQVVTWGLSGAGCTGNTCGQISATGQYKAPATIPNPNVVTVTATPIADTTKTGLATVYVGSGSPVKVTTSPSSVSVLVGQNQQFTAAVTGTTNSGVIWSISGIGCAGTACGQINQFGVFTAPPTAPTPPSVNVTATSLADPTRSGSSLAAISANVKVSITPTSVHLSTGQTTQFTAAVTGTTNTKVTWSLSGSGCSGNGCGTVSQSGLYSAPGTVQSTIDVAVKATSQADVSKSATAAVTVAPPLKVTVAPQNIKIVVSGQQQFVATVNGSTSNAPVNWSLSGKACPNACGSITTAGLYTAPSALTNSPVTVTATAQANNTSFANATVEIIPANAIKLNGQYAFLFHGTDSSGLYQAAGSFVADGQGNIQSGIEDINHTAGPLTGLSFSGTYTVGGDNRGVLNITNSQGSYSYAFTLNGSGSLARFIEIDSSGVRGAGVMKLQNPSAFNNNAISGGYTISLSGADSRGARIASLSSIFPSGGGFIAGSSLDVNEGGNTLPTFVTFNGSYSVGSNGRGTFALSVPGFQGGNFHFAMYVVSSGEFFLVSTDALSFLSPWLNGEALLQAGAPFSSNSFNGNSVFYETGWTGSAPDVSAGLLTYDGHGTISMQSDENNGGQVALGNLMTGAYGTQLNGRTTLNLVNLQNHQPYLATMYAVSQNTAFIMDQSPSVRSGYVEAQTVAPPFSDSNLAGLFTFATASPLGSSSPFVSGSLLFDGNGSVQGNQDQDTSSGRKQNQTVSGMYSVSPAAHNGRSVIILSLPQQETIATWLATYSRAYGIPADASDTAPEVLIFEQ